MLLGQRLTQSRTGKRRRDSAGSLNFEQGVAQSLGFKEFEPYLRLKFEVCVLAPCACVHAVHSVADCSQGVRTQTDASERPAKKARTEASGSAGVPSSEAPAALRNADHKEAKASEQELRDCLLQCIERLKTSTRQYARCVVVCSVTFPSLLPDRAMGAVQEARAVDSEPAAWPARCRLACLPARHNRSRCRVVRVMSAFMVSSAALRVNAQSDGLMVWRRLPFASAEVRFEDGSAVCSRLLAQECWLGSPNQAIWRTL